MCGSMVFWFEYETSSMESLCTGLTTTGAVLGHHRNLTRLDLVGMILALSCICPLFTPGIAGAGESELLCALKILKQLPWLPTFRYQEHTSLCDNHKYVEELPSPNLQRAALPLKHKQSPSSSCCLCSGATGRRKVSMETICPQHFPHYSELCS